MEHHDTPIFIFASGQRCGSTLLQRYLCSHPNILIWGEHDGVLNKIFNGFDRLLEWEGMFRHQYKTFLAQGINNFIPNMNPHHVLLRRAQIEMIRNLWQVPAMGLGRAVWGFKEVLYDAQMASYLHDLFPQMKLIYLTRNIFECFISLKHEEYIPPTDQPHVPLTQVWTRERTKEFISDWVRINRSFQETPPPAEWCMPITYEALTNEPQAVSRRITDWLGFPHDAFDMDVFQHKIYTDRHNGPDPRPVIQRKDLSAEEVALVTTDDILHISRGLGYDMRI
jgi:hypothetical protein